MTRIVFIAGMEHSGTTLLDYILSGQENVVGLGEVFTLLDRSQRETYARMWGRFEDSHQCSCGLEFDQCPVWKDVHQAIAADPAKASAELYAILYEAAARQLGPGGTIIDSSKSPKALDVALNFARRNAIDLRIVFMIKDVRAFVTSVKYAHKLGLKGQYAAFSWWQAVNRGYLERLRREDLPVRLVTYEDLCLRTEPTLGALFAFCGLEGGNLVMGHNRAHILTGNKDMLNKTRQEIAYDDRWRLEDKIKLMYWLQPRARQLNRQLRLNTSGELQDIAL